jgi:hypothetical protein
MDEITKENNINDLIECPECKGVHSVDAQYCPHCGRPRQPVAKSNKNLMITGIGIILGIAVIGWILIYPILYSGPPVIDRPTGFPTCDSAQALTNVKSVFANSPMAKTTGLSIVTFSNIYRLPTSTFSRLQCRAQILLNDATPRSLRYDFYMEGNQMLVYEQLEVVL